jgi:hypothetical protein
MSPSSGRDGSQLDQLTGETFCQFPVFEAFLVTTAAVLDDTIDVVGRNVAATNVTVIVIFTVERADRIGRHSSLFM